MPGTLSLDDKGFWNGESVELDDVAEDFDQTLLF